MLLQQLDITIQNFIWSGDTHKRPSVTVAWINVCSSKSKWGLGLHSFLVAQAFFFHFTWDFIIYLALYFDFLHRRYLDYLVRLRNRYITSSIWPGIRDHYSTLVEELRWLVGDLSSARFWLVRIWCNSVHGQVTSQLAYWKLGPWYPTVSWGKWLWSTFIPPRHSLVVWRAIHHRLPLLDSFCKHGFIGPSFYSLCRQQEESLDHIFIECPFVLTLWHKIMNLFMVHLDFSLGPISFFFMPWKLSLVRSSPLFGILLLSRASGSFGRLETRLFFRMPLALPFSLVSNLLALIWEGRHLDIGTMHNTVKYFCQLHALSVPGKPPKAPTIVEVK